MEMRERQIKEAYQSGGTLYDRMMTDTPWWFRLYNRVIWGLQDMDYVPKVLKWIPEDFTGRLLDVPLGSATFTCEKYAEIPNAAITGLDYSEKMLHMAKRRFSERNLHHISTEQGDVGEMRFPDEFFDIVLSMNGFHAFPDKEKAFAETARVLKKGGIFCGCFYIRGEKKITDWFIKAFFVPRGFFTPPFYTGSELTSILHQYYQGVEVYHQSAMGYFRCVK